MGGSVGGSVSECLGGWVGWMRQMLDNNDGVTVRAPRTSPPQAYTYITSANMQLHAFLYAWRFASCAERC